MCFGSGEPSIDTFFAPVHSAGAVAARRAFGRGAVELHELGIVYVGAKGALDRLKVRAMAV